MEYMISLLFFNLGLCIQGYLLLNDRSRKGAFAAIISLGLLALLFGTILTGGSYGAAGYSLAVFALFFWVSFHDEALPDISEKTVLFYTCLFWYVFLGWFYAECPVVAAAALIPTLAVLAACASKARTDLWSKLLLYIWFLLIIIFLAYFQITQGASFLFMEKNMPLDPLNAFTMGMVSLYFSFYLLTAFMLIVYPAEDRQFSDDETKLTKHARSTIEHYLDIQTKASHAAMLIIAFAVFYAANHYARFLPDYLVVNLAVILFPLTQPKDLASRYKKLLRKEKEAARADREKLRREVLGWMTKED